MQTELQVELIHCPNCREEVPKTLYCLNCGYPLYKLEDKKPESDETEDVSVEVTPEPFEVESAKEPVEVEIPAPVEALPQATVEESSEEVEIDIEEETVMIIEPEEMVETVELEEPEEVEQVVDVEPEVEPISEVVEEEYTAPEEEAKELLEGLEEAATEIDMEEDVEIVEAEEPEFPELPDVVEEVKHEAVLEEPVPEVVAEPTPEFEPDPIIKEVMDNFTKNISLKIRLVNLLREGDVKLETFNRLFESYAARGERLMNSRNETLERIRFDLNTMEGALEEAKIGLEELEIRRSIGDASEDEYHAKAPAFNWDIEHHSDMVGRKKREIEYLDNLANTMSREDMDELKGMAETCHEAMDGMTESELISSEMAARIKVTMEEAIACLKGSKE